MFDYFFELVSSLTRPVAIANANAGILMVAMAIYTGYLIPLPEMHPWFKWIVYVNPLGYAFQSLMANEFHGQKMECNTLIPSGPGYENVSLANQACAFTGSVPGQSYVSGDDYIYLSYNYKWSHTWRNIAILCGFWTIFIVCGMLASEYMKPMSSQGDVLLVK